MSDGGSSLFYFSVCFKILYPITNSVTGHCTFSSVLTCFFNYWAQITWQNYYKKMKKSLTENLIFCAVYSRWCLTSAVQSFFKYRPSRHNKLLQIKPTMTFVFLIFADIWSSYCKSPSRITLRSFHSNTCSNSWLWNIIKHFFLPECQRHEKPTLPKCKMITLLKWMNIRKLPQILCLLTFCET